MGPIWATSGQPIWDPYESRLNRPYGTCMDSPNGTIQIPVALHVGPKCATDKVPYWHPCAPISNPRKRCYLDRCTYMRGDAWIWADSGREMYSGYTNWGGGMRVPGKPNNGFTEQCAELFWVFLHK